MVGGFSVVYGSYASALVESDVLKETWSTVLKKTRVAMGVGFILWLQLSLWLGNYYNITYRFV